MDDFAASQVTTTVRQRKSLSRNGANRDEIVIDEAGSIHVSLVIQSASGLIERLPPDP
jgi:hypothetical protein